MNFIKKILTEARMEDALDIDKVFSPSWMRGQMKEDWARYSLEYFKADYDLEEVEDDEVLKMPEFKSYIEDQLHGNLGNQLNQIRRSIKGGYITIYRAITVDDKWVNHLVTGAKHLGIYWTFEERSAEAHWGYQDGKRITVVFTAVISEKHIDWMETFRLNADPNLGEAENEIRLFKNTPLNITGITIDEEEFDMSKIKNKKFYA